jgi:4-hydroxy-tetrahydrodipicolinate reductase
MINIGLLGFGRTGKKVAKEILNDKDCSLEFVLRKSYVDVGKKVSKLLGKEDYGNSRIYSIQDIESFESFYKGFNLDLLIDFSSAGAIDEYREAIKLGIKIVSAVSDYDKTQLKRLKEYSKQSAILHSTNITLGINFLIKVSKMLKEIIPKADVEIVEEHFKEKKKVSGTALKIAKLLKVKKVHSIRAGGIVGRHEVIFGLPNQIIRITHESLSRSAFGQGAIFGAKWLVKQKKGFYTFEDII